jgi:hypothetical protein
MNSKQLALACGLAIALSGCAQHYSFKGGQIDPADFGEANRQTYAAMVVNPDPVYAEPLATSGERAAAAIERYNEGEVETPERVSSTASIGGGGGGGN